MACVLAWCNLHSWQGSKCQEWVNLYISNYSHYRHVLVGSVHSDFFLSFFFFSFSSLSLLFWILIVVPTNMLRHVPFFITLTAWPSSEVWSVDSASTSKAFYADCSSMMVAKPLTEVVAVVMLFFTYSVSFFVPRRVERCWIFFRGARRVISRLRRFSTPGERGRGRREGGGNDASKGHLALHWYCLRLGVR